MARDFESGSSQYLEVASTPVTVVDLTIAAWIKPETASQSYICGIFDNAGDVNWFGLKIGGAGPGIQAVASNTTENAAVTSTTVVAGSWQHACATFGPAAGTDRAAYLNGAGKGTNTTNRTPAGLDRISIGVRGSLTRAQYFDGLIAEVTIWSAQLNDNEVASLAGRVHPLTVRSAAIVAYWPLYGVGSPEPNLGTSSLNMTVTGATLSEDHPPIAPFPPAERIWFPAGVAGPATVSGAAVLSGAGAASIVGTATISGSVSATSTIVSDNFDDNSIDGAWSQYVDTGCSLTETSQQLQVALTSGGSARYANLSRGSRGIVGTTLTGRLKQITAEDIFSGYAYLVLLGTGPGGDIGYNLGVGVDGWIFEQADDGDYSDQHAFVPPSVPYWYRIRVTAATAYAEHSADGVAWTTLASYSMLPVIAAGANCRLEVGAFVKAGGISGTYVWDDITWVESAPAQFGTGTLTATGGRLVTGAAVLSGAGALSVVGSVLAVHAGAATLSGAGALTVVGQRTAFAVAALSGSGALVVPASVAVRFGAVVLDGDGALVGVGAVLVPGSAALSGAGILEASAYLLVFGRPDSVVAAGGWTPSSGTLWGCIDEVSPNDAGYIRSSGLSGVLDTCELGLTDVEDPGLHAGHAVTYRYRKDTLEGPTVELTVSLVQGETVIASWFHPDVEAISTVRQELTEAEAETISNYSDLRLRFEAEAE